MEEGSWLPQESTKHSHGAMAEEEEEDLGSVSSFSDDDEGGGPSTASSGLSTPASSDDGLDDHEGRLYDMSNLMAQLPPKRGLSRFFDGKSQSFTSLADAKMLQDLPKTDRSSSCKKQNQTKTCKSSANVHTNIYSKTIRKVKMRPSRSGHLMCSSVLAYCCNEKQDADFASTESKQRSVLR